MYTSIRIPEALAALARSQGGVLNAEQATAAGVSREATRRLQRAGTWHRLGTGVWSTQAEPSWAAFAWAGLLQCSQGVLGGAAAGHLYGLCEEPAVIDVWSPQQRRRSRARWRFRHGLRTGFGEPARLRIEQAAMEMCAELSEAGIVAVMAKAVGTRRTTPARLRAAALNARNTKGRRLILDILDDVADGVESPLEHRYLVDVERAHGLPTAFRQVALSTGTRSDVAHVEFGLLVELDGRLWHEGLAAWGDMDRDNRHELASLTTLRFGWDAVVRTPCHVAAQVAEALRQGGWTGLPRRCRRCA